MSFRGVQWKQGVVICMLLYTSSSHNTTPIHCTPLRLHPSVMNTHSTSPISVSVKKIPPEKRARGKLS